MTAALIAFACSTGILLLLIFLYTAEDVRGRRILLSGVRSFFDRVLLGALAGLRRMVDAFNNSFMRLLLHYGVHSILKRILAALRHFEKRIEDLVRRNRTIARRIRASKEKGQRTHLDEIASHKEEVALTKEEREKRLNQ
jgi:hypothetical protein